MHAFSRVVVCASVALSVVGCTEFEVTNSSSSAVTFRIGPESAFSDPESDLTVHEIEAGATDTVVANVPLNVDEAMVRGTGTYVNTIELVSKDTPTFEFVDNAGAILVTNTGTTPIDTVHVASINLIGEQWVLGLGNWGEDLGPIAPGESVERIGVGPADDYAVKYAGTIQLLPQYTVDVGMHTDVELNADDDDNDDNE